MLAGRDLYGAALLRARLAGWRLYGTASSLYRIITELLSRIKVGNRGMQYSI